MLTQPLTFEQLPSYIYELGQKIDQIFERINQPACPAVLADDLLNVTQAAELLSLTTATIYGMVYEKRIPFSKPEGSGRLYFVRSELIEWVKNGRKSTAGDLDEQARQQLATRIGRRNQSKARKEGRSVA